MIKAPELLEPKGGVEVKEKEEVSPEVEAIRIEREIMKRSLKRSSLKPKEWIDKHAKEYRELFDANKERFIEMHRKDPEALYEFLEKILESESHN